MPSDAVVMLSTLLAKLAAGSGIDLVALVDASGFATEAIPLGGDAEGLAANVHSLSEQVSGKEDAAMLTIIAERGYILAIPLAKGYFLAIQATDSASLGKLRHSAQQFAERISALLNP